MSDSTMREAYSTDLTDEQWAIIAPIISHTPNEHRRGRRREVSLREVINAILYINRTGCQWDLLPNDLLPKSTVYDYFAKWRDDGTWDNLMCSPKVRCMTTSQSGEMTAPGTTS